MAHGGRVRDRRESESRTEGRRTGAGVRQEPSCRSDRVVLHSVYDSEVTSLERFQKSTTSLIFGPSKTPGVGGTPDSLERTTSEGITVSLSVRVVEGPGDRDEVESVSGQS